MSTVPVYLAFRVFGNFHWPPVRTDFDSSTNDTGKTLQKGVVEIYFAPPGSGVTDDLVAYLRWTARNDDLAPLTPDFLTDVNSAVDINASDDALNQALSDPQHPGQAVFRLTNTTPQAGKERRLLFRGAFLFDQFALDATRNSADPGKSNTPALDLRWVLARTFTHYNKNGVFGSNFFSEMVIGQPGDTQASGCSIRFNLALPTPGAQSGDDTHRCYALPFAAIFSPKMKMPAPSAPSAAAAAASFIAGPGPSNSLFDGPAVTVPPKVKDAQLGQFGFCAGVGAGTDEFLYFPRYTHGGDFRFNSFWPTSPQAFVQDFLGKLSQPASVVQPEKYLSLDTNAQNAQGELSHSVRFRVDGGRTVMTFRTTVTVPALPSPTPALLTPDLRVDWGIDRPLSFQLHVPHRDEWLHTRTDTLHIDREIAYTIADQAIWSFAADAPARPAAGGDITVRIGFAEKRNDGNATGVVYLKDLFDRATAATQLPRGDLRNIADGQPQSILPSFGMTWPTLPDFGGSPDPTTPRFLLCGAMQFDFQRPSTVGGMISWKQKFPTRKIWAGLDLDLGLWPDAHNINIDEQDGVVPGRINVTLSPVSFSYTTDPLKVSLVADPTMPSGDPSRWGRFRIAPAKATSAPLTARLGGLEFSATTADNHGVYNDTRDEDYSYWRFGDRSVAGSAATNADLRLRLPIATIRPIVTDTAWGDRSGGPAPLLIPLGASAGSGQFLLDLRETVAQYDDRHLTASIYDTGEGSSDSGDYVILSEQPFSIIRLHSQPLQDRGTQDNTLVATFDSDTRQWQVKLTAETYHYAFPPQVAGESMDKPRRLEIADYNPAPATMTGMPPATAPVDLSPPNDANGKPSDPNNHPFAVEFRLTPSAEIWIQPSDLERGYFLPEWASHEIFRQRGDLGVGAAMVGLRGEFLYGLSVGIDPSRETGAARSARVAEIEALLGKPPRKLGVANTSTALARRWTALDQVIARRPERIEIWAQDPNSSVPLAPAKFSDGVTFSLRETALHRPALPLSKDELNGLDQPHGKPRVSNNGLSGGALWPLESKNFFNSMIQNPTSGGGTIEQIALSPIGGDANQKAEFLNGKVRIISETRNGFVQRHKIEIIGRISVFWHWAKYVVVYERTVNPSAQFTPDGGVGRRTRRPVLRKVSEYIYIRQPQGIRRYPDFPAAGPISAGLLKAVKFNSITINVDSAWSEDVGQYGWRIPLWNRDAARRRPQVYPRPDIAFSTFAEGQGDEAETSQECIEPDNIYFYADASPITGADTDGWPSLAGIDCSMLPPPTADFQRKLKSTDKTDTKPSAPRIPRGHRRFTWRLAPPSKKTALNAGRSDKPLFAGLESITFMRSNEAQSSASLKSAVDASDQLSAPTVNPAQKLPIWNPNGTPPAQFATVGTTLNDFLNAAHAHTPDLPTITAKANALKTELNKIGSALATDPVLSQYVGAAKKNADALKNIRTFAGNAPQQCEQLADDFVGSIKRKELLIIDAIQTWQASDPLPLINQPFPKTRAKLVDFVADLLKHPLDAALSGAGADIGRANVGIEKARSIVQGFYDEIVGAKDNVSRQLVAFKNSYNDGKPWSDSRVADLQTKLLSQGAAAFHAIQTAVEEAQVCLTSELTGFAQGIANVVQHLMDAIAASGADIQTNFAANWKLLATYLQEAIKRIDAVLKDAAGHDQFQFLDDKLMDLKARAAAKFGNQYDADFEGIRNGLSNLKQGLMGIRAWLVIQQTAPAAATSVITEAVRRGQAALGPLVSVTRDAIALLGKLQGQIDVAADQVIADLNDAVATFNDLGTRTFSLVSNFDGAIDGVVDEMVDEVSTSLEGIVAQITPLFGQINVEADRLKSQISRLQTAVGPDAVSEFLKQNVLTKAVDAALSGVTDDELKSYTDAERARLTLLIGDLSGYVQQQLETLTDTALGTAKDQVVSVCNLVGSGLKQGYDLLDDMTKEVQRRIAAIGSQIDAALGDPKEALTKIVAFAEGFAADVRQINNDIATSYASATGYGNRVLEAAGNLGSGGIGAVPGNILRLYAAGASAPTLPNLDFDRERLGYYYSQLKNVIDTTPAEAWFGRLGDELKALGLNLPFSKLGDGILPDDLSNFDISRIFKNFSGMKLDKLFQGYKLPPGAKDAIKLTHAFDKAQARAWVEIDVDLPMTDRKAMFSIGPFELDYVNSRFVAMVRWKRPRTPIRSTRSAAPR